ncbi:hypothetical protein HPB52_007569 [Rhipicephalus sanguineus]|uniref:Uncharacterized protein n=1 Tax=Rhipicephalus sanguineus TaxID=34632 RepID=A0A9D4PN43_RHISA|nr:hypothetical protein HPB52_007569 [Rhipicephalus sanguineus]
MVCFPLMGEAVATEQCRLVAFIFKTLALELYQSKNELDPNVKAVLDKAKEGAPIKAWSKCRHMQIAPAEKNAILQDLFTSLVAEGVPDNFKISIVLGELYLVLLKHWISNITSTVTEWTNSIDTVLGILQQGTTSLHPRLALVLSAIGASMVKILKQQLATKKEECELSVHLWVASLCPLLTFYGRKCAEEGLKLPSSLSAQVCTTLTTFLKDLLSLSNNNAGCIPILQQNLVVAQLTNLLQVSLQVRFDEHKEL